MMARCVVGLLAVREWVICNCGVERCEWYNFLRLCRKTAYEIGDLIL